MGVYRNSESIAIDPDTMRIIAQADVDASNYLEFDVDDGGTYVGIKAKVGDIRFLDPDGAADYFNIQSDPASGSLLLTTSCITDKNLFEIDHNGTMSGASASATIYQMVLDGAGITINDGAANACYLQGLRMEWGSITPTAVTLSEIAGIDITLPTTGAYNAEYGAYLKADKGDAPNGAISLLTSRDIAAAITADRAFGDYAVQLTQVGNNTSAGDFDLTDAAASGLLKLVLSHTTATTVGAKTDPDVCQGKALYIEVTGTTNDANTKLDFYPRAVDIVYTLTETLGTLRMAGTDIFRITPTIPNGLSSAGAFQFDVAEYNFDNVVLNDANITFNGLYIDASGLTNTSSALATLINLLCPDDSNIDQAIKVIADTTTANSMQVITASRDINGTVAGAVALTNYANVLGQAVAHSGGDFIVTQTAGTAGILQLNLDHQTTVACTAADVFASTALDINVTCDVNVGTTDARIDCSARALDIAYTIAETDGVMRMAATDIMRIVATIPNGLTSAGAFDFNVQNINLDSVILNDANITFSGIMIDASGLTNTASAVTRLISVIAPDDSNIDEMLSLIADTTTANSTQNIETSRDINGTVAGAVALTNYANVLGQAVAHSGGDFIVTQTAGTAGILDLVLSHSTTLDTTAPDVFASTALNINIDAVCNSASADLDATPRAIDINYLLTETAGTLRWGSTDIIRVDFGTSGTLSSAGASTINILNLDAVDVTINDSNIAMNALNVDMSTLTLTDASSLHGAQIIIPTLVGQATTRYGLYASDGSFIARLVDGSMGVSATGVNDEKYYRCEDFDEEAAAVTLDAGLRADEWTFGGTNGDAGDVTYIQSAGGAIRMETDGADDDSVYALWLNTAVYTTANPIIEFRVRVDSVSANMTGFAVGLAEAGTFTTMAFDAVDDDYILMCINSDTANPANLKLSTEDNNGGITTADLGVAMSANTWCTIRIDCTDTEQPRIFVNNTGGAITPSHEIAAATVGAGTIQAGIYMYPVLFVICLDATPSARHIDIDYIKIWQDRA